nr:myotubularin-related protein 13-like [Lytechinus pictus]
MIQARNFQKIFLQSLNSSLSKARNFQKISLNSSLIQAKNFQKIVHHYHFVIIITVSFTVSSEFEFQPDTGDELPEDFSSEFEFQPDTGQELPEDFSSEFEFQPDTGQELPEDFSSEFEFQPDTGHELPEDFSSEFEFQPDTGQELPEDFSSEFEFQPDTGHELPEDFSSEFEFQPDTGHELPEDFSSEFEFQPDTGHELQKIVHHCHFVIIITVSFTVSSEFEFQPDTGQELPEDFPSEFEFQSVQGKELPEDFSSEFEFQPDTGHELPEDFSSEFEFQPDTGQELPEDFSSEFEFQPDTGQELPEDFSSEFEFQPDTGQELPEDFSSEFEFQPDTGQELPEDFSSEFEFQPDTGQELPEDFSSEFEFQPDTGQELPEDFSSEFEFQPDTGQELPEDCQELPEDYTILSLFLSQFLQSLNSSLSKARNQKNQIVPYNASSSFFEGHRNLINNSARRLEVLRTCITFIFENKILDARRLFPAVMRSLKSRVARQALLHELELHVNKNRAMLEPQQFGMVVRLINAALQEDSHGEEFSLSMDFLPLISAFCRKLCPGIIQFAYTVTQDHPMFASQQFWETAFYADVEKNIQSLYVTPDNTPTNEKRDTFNEAFAAGPDASGSSSSSANGLITSAERSPLDIAAEQLRLQPNMNHDAREEAKNNEESIVYSQAVHYANRMVCMRVPLDSSRGLKNSITLEGDSGGSSNITGSVGGSDSYDAENNFDESDPRDVPNRVIKFISRFVDKVCTEAGVSHEHLKNLHGLIPGLVAMHIETLDAVNRESKRLPPIQKPKILKPTFLPGEEKVMEGLRGYLVMDGREEGQGGVMGGPTLLPAEGAVFLTTYRIIFKGTPIDMQACEQVVTRSFPVSALSKEKKINVTNIGNTFHLDQFLPEGIQLRSNTFQLMKIVFDAEVSLERLETFRKMCNKLRYPQSIFHTFAYPRHLISPALSTQMKHKEKSATLRKLATKTFLRGGKKSTKMASRKDKYVLPPGGSGRPMPLASSTMLKDEVLTSSMESVQTDSRPGSIMFDEDELSNVDLSSFLTLERGQDFGDQPTQVIDEADSSATLKPSDMLTVEKLAERLYVQDYTRLGLGLLGNGAISRPRVGDMFKISEVNSKFEVARSYPALIVVPSVLSDDSIRRLAKCHRHGRLPAITWRHQRTKGLLIRSSGFHGKGVMGMIKSAQTQGSSTGESSSSGSSKSLEQEKYLSAIVLNTPYGSAHKSDSLVSLNSILPPTNSGETPDGTPTISPRKGTHGTGTLLQRGFLRSSGGQKAYMGKPGIFDIGVATLRRGSYYVFTKSY